MKVLVIDDATELHEVVSLCFEMRWPQSTILAAETAEEGIQLAQSSSPDVVVLEISLPDRDGFQVCREIRSFSDVPIIILTARSDDQDIVKGLEWGADDYITKPFSYIQFLARVQAVIRRSQSLPLGRIEQPFVTNDLTIYFDTREVEVRGQPVKLTNIEYNLLFHLVKNAGKPLSTGMLLAKVWGPQYRNTSYLPKVHIQHLRQKIERDPANPRLITTERGIGYKFVMLP
jgi:two-component system KDP operon response regulator KdpE